MAYEKLVVRKNVQLNYDADDWDLYTSVDSVELAASALNATFEEAVNKGGTRDEVENIMGKRMNEFRHFGANDSEPYRVLDNLLDKVFGRGF